MDRVAAFMSEKTPRRFVAIATFVALLYLFRSLAILLVFFVAFERTLGWCSQTLATRAGIGRIRTTAESTRGGGSKASGGTSSTDSMA